MLGNDGDSSVFRAIYVATDSNEKLGSHGTLSYVVVSSKTSSL